MERKIDWYRTPLDKDLLRRLTARSDARGLLQAGSFLLVFAATAYLPYFFFVRGLWLPMVVAGYLHCLFHGFVGMQAALHELSHGTPFKSKWLNEAFYHLFSFLSWNNPVHFRASHLLHHQFTVHRGLDKEVVLEPISFTWLDYSSWFLFDFRWFKQIMFPDIAHFFGKADVDFFFWDPLFPAGDPRRRQMCAWARVLVLGHLGLCPNAPDWRVSCHTVRFDAVTAYLYWNMNFHTEHHMYAAVPFFNLPRLHQALAPDLPAPPPSFLAGIRRILAIQRRQRQDPAYCFVPEFPATAASPRWHS